MIRRQTRTTLLPYTTLYRTHASEVRKTDLYHNTRRRLGANVGIATSGINDSRTKMILASIQRQRAHASKGSHRRDQSRDRNHGEHQDQTNKSPPQTRKHTKTNMPSRTPC